MPAIIEDALNVIKKLRAFCRSCDARVFSETAQRRLRTIPFST
jgi:hypothetical protein